MIARSRAEAVEEFLRPVRAAASCVTRTPIIGSGFHPSSTPHFCVFAPHGDPVPIRGSLRLSLWLALRYDVIQHEQSRHSWYVQSIGYQYALLNREGREVLAYHWHPEGRSPAHHPHLHIGPAFNPVVFAKAHLPVGSITLASIVRFLITDLGVEPVRANWKAILDPLSAV